MLPATKVQVLSEGRVVVLVTVPPPRKDRFVSVNSAHVLLTVSFSTYIMPNVLSCLTQQEIVRTVPMVKLSVTRSPLVPLNDAPPSICPLPADTCEPVFVSVLALDVESFRFSVVPFPR